MVTLLRRTPTERERWADEVLDQLSPVMTALGVLFLLVVLGESVAARASVAVALTVLGWGCRWSSWSSSWHAWWWPRTRAASCAATGGSCCFLVLPFLRVLRVVPAARFLRTGRVLSSAVRSSRSAHQVLGGRIGWLGVVWAITVMGSSQLLFQFSAIRPVRGRPACHARWRPSPASRWASPTASPALCEVALAVFSVVFATLAAAWGPSSSSAGRPSTPRLRQQSGNNTALSRKVARLFARSSRGVADVVDFEVDFIPVRAASS